MTLATDDAHNELDLGFLVESPNWILESRFFRSKVGGHPSWLELQDLPTTEERLCPNPDCREPMIFLAQIYAPLDDPDTFHRTLFVFMCMHSSCHLSDKDWTPFAVFRSQLPRENNYYPSDPPVEKPTWKPDITASSFGKLCRFCGCQGDKNCGGCRKVSYCSREHQLSDWKSGHKKECKNSSDENLNSFSTGEGRLPEFELVTQPAESDDQISDDSNEEDSEDEAKLEKENMKCDLAAQNAKLGKEDVEKYVTDDQEVEDEVFERFTRITANSPKQVLRYQRTGKPLWICKQEIPDSSVVPPCQYCGDKRVFEFQIMPQMLCSLKLDKKDTASVDWGVLCIYTCYKSCSGSPAYKKEILIRQCT